MACCQIFVQDGDSLPYCEEKFNSRRGHRLQLDASEGPEYPLELDDERFTIPAWPMLNRPSSPSESVSEESMSMHSEESLSDEDDDWQESGGLAQRVITTILKILDAQKVSPFEGQKGKVRKASGEGGVGDEKSEQQKTDPEKDVEDEEAEAEDEEGDDTAPAPAAPHVDGGKRLNDSVEQHLRNIKPGSALAKALLRGYIPSWQQEQSDVYERNKFRKIQGKLVLQEAVKAVVDMRMQREDEDDDLLYYDPSDEDDVEEAGPSDQEPTSRKRPHGEDDDEGGAGAGTVC